MGKMEEGGGPGPDQYFYNSRYRYRNKKTGIKYLLLTFYLKTF